MHLPDEPFTDQEDPEGETRVQVHLGDMAWELISWDRHLAPGAIPDCDTHKRLLSYFFR